MFSCNHTSNVKTIKSTYTGEDTIINEKELEKKAYELYINKKCSEAIIYYDKLISIDSTKGGYYYKRGYCKTMLLNEADAIADFLKAIERNYNQKQLAYLSIGLIHRKTAIFHSTTDYARAAEYDTALYFYNECLKIDPDNVQAIQEKNEVIENLKRLRN